ncbi:pentatricopeptide repeat-containing protein At2g20710, mitochondrial-like [Prunus dulcis]|uniref:pentatricopeptide repeat-containing protein At2g20710, mitochondrial-like n=1 Tax=Prunus dulcis TaxID=3755 RepID=UPI0014836558|nr:pentatricopeptide repeat-containing protein At2g20710, mitochondrial-like [Prunus dulcis]
MKHSRFSSLFNLYSRFGFRNVPGVSLYSTATDPTYHHRKCWNGALNNLYGRISRVGDRNACILPILDEWIEEGGNAEKDDLVTIIKELRQFKYYKHALELSMWMTDKRYFSLMKADVAIRLDLISKVHGIEQAENYFENIPKQLKALEVYCTLLNCYAHVKLVEKAEATMQKMRDLGFARTPLVYNALLNLYYKTGNTDKFDVLLNVMEESGISCDRCTYGIRLSAYASASDHEGIDKVVAEWESNPGFQVDWINYSVAANGYVKVGNVERALEMLEKSEKLISSSERPRAVYEHLMTQYAVLGKKDDVVRLWKLYSKHMKIYNKGYIAIITSLLKFGDVESAEKIYEEWESRELTFDIRIPNHLIGAYARRGLFDKAEAFLNRIILKGGKLDTRSWFTLARLYLDRNQIEKAVELMRRALLTEGPQWMHDKRVLAVCLRHMKKRPDLEGAEEFIRQLGDNCVIPVSVQERLLDYINKDDSVSRTR